jgi:aspartate dehydrogenase
MNIGILGCGTIANIIVNKLIHDDKIHINYFYDNDIEKAKKLAILTGGTATLNFDSMVNNVDLVLESASPESVPKYGPKVLNKGKNIIILSIGALMNKSTRKNMEQIAKKNKAKIFAPSGAIIGIDGIKAASIGKIGNVSLTTRKPPQSLGRNVNKQEILFEGKASEAVNKFPLNINVAAALSIACNMEVNVKIIIDPNVDKNVHEISVEGDFGEFTTKTKNLPSESNPRTSVLAAYSAIKLLKSLNETINIGT